MRILMVIYLEFIECLFSYTASSSQPPSTAALFSIVFILLSRELGPREMMPVIQNHTAIGTQAEG